MSLILPNKVIALSLLAIFCLSVSAASESTILQDNMFQEQKEDTNVTKDFDGASSLRNKYSEHGVIKTSKPKLTTDKAKDVYGSYVDWHEMQKALHTQKDVILYCVSIIILTTVMLLFVKVLKSKYYTNKFNEKDLFTARKLFKGTNSGSMGGKQKGKDQLKVIEEAPNESYDVENGKSRDSCQTSSEIRISEMKQSCGAYSSTFNSQIDGERINGVFRKNHHERKTDEEPEIMSMFSADKSQEYIIPQRKYIKPNFEGKREDRINYYQEKAMAIFGYEDIQEQRMPKFDCQKKSKKVDLGVKELQLKFNFSESESEMDDDNISQDGGRLEANQDYGRQTIDLNGPIYDPGLLPRHKNICMSELGHAESEADDVNRILDQMDSKSFIGFGASDLDNSMAERLNEGAMLRPKRYRKCDLDDIMI